MERDERVFILGEEVGVWVGRTLLPRAFMIILAKKGAGYAYFGNCDCGAPSAPLTGMRPVAELMTINFAFVAMDHIVNEAAKLHYMFAGQLKLPLVIRTTSGGGRQLGATHSQTPDAIFAHFPGLKVVSPGTPADAKGLLKSAIRSEDPVLFIENATLYQSRGEVPEDEDYLEPLGKSKVQREGDAVTIVAYSKMVPAALQAADMLSEDGIEAEVIDLRSLRPLDMEPIIASFNGQTVRLWLRKVGDPMVWGRRSLLEFMNWHLTMWMHRSNELHS